ncbi:nuclear transport factor 2 family protein [Georgenia sp. AZ-5]|uniref:nuclear transport factor 2 family protein n=1 Tax=Georgenia sp. AZ-5 TaxID=3367526 RepID=UPI0037550620
MSDIDTGKALVTSYLDAVSALDVGGIATLFREDGKVLLPYAPPGVPPAIEGQAAIDAYYRALPDMATNLNFRDYQIFALDAPGEFVAEYTSDSSMKATGARYRNRYITRVTVRGAKIAVLAEFFNPVPLVEALGGHLSLPAAAAP